MAFVTKQDYYNLADSSSLLCVSTNDGATASVAEAHGDNGEIVASTVYAETSAPSCDYILKANWTKAANAIGLGSVSTVSSKKFALASITITTATGAAPTVSASGEQVESTATTGCVFSCPAISLPKTHHAHTLFSAFTLSGSGCHLTGATYTLSANISKATKDGECVAFDVSDGKITASVTIVQTGTAAPTLSAGTDWEITSPLACSNPDANYPTFTGTLTKYLAKTEVS